LSEDELAAVMTCMNVAEIETDREEDSLFIVTLEQVKSKNRRVVEAEVAERRIFGPTQEDGLEDDDNGFALEDLNRAAAEAVPLKDMRGATEADPGAQGVIESLDHHQGRKRDTAALKWKVNDGVIYAIEFGQAERVYIPENLRERILKVYHEGDWNMHAGRETTLESPVLL